MAEIKQITLGQRRVESLRGIGVAQPSNRKGQSPESVHELRHECVHCMDILTFVCTHTHTFRSIFWGAQSLALVQEYRVKHVDRKSY